MKPPVKPLALVAGLCVVALAGCSSPADPASGGTGWGDQAVQETWFLDADGGLLDRVPAAHSRDLGWSYQDWFAGREPPTWAGEARDVAVALSEVRLQYLVAVTQPMASTAVRPQMTAWWGVGDDRVTHEFVDGPPVLLPGDTVAVTTPLRTPPGGLVVPAGGVPEIAIASYYPDQEAVPGLRVVVGDPERPSRVTWNATPTAIAQGSAIGGLDEEVRLLGGRCVVDMADAGVAAASFALEVGPAARAVEVAVDRLDGDAVADVDFAIMDANGTLVGRGAGPGGHEHLLLAAANLDGAARGTWILVVYNCHPQAATIAVAATVYGS